MNRKKYLFLVIALMVIAGAIFLLVKLINQKKLALTNKLTAQSSANLKTTFAERTQSIRKLLAQKLNQPVDNIQVNIAQEDERYIKGIVDVTDPAGQTIKVGSQDVNIPKIKSEGIFLATKVNGAWEIVADGQSKYTCAAISSYNFPSDLVNDCQK